MSFQYVSHSWTKTTASAALISLVLLLATLADAVAEIAILWHEPIGDLTTSGFYVDLPLGLNRGNYKIDGHIFTFE